MSDKKGKVEVTEQVHLGRSWRVGEAYDPGSDMPTGMEEVPKDFLDDDGATEDEPDDTEVQLVRPLTDSQVDQPAPAGLGYYDEPPTEEGPPLPSESPAVVSIPTDTLVQQPALSWWQIPGNWVKVVTILLVFVVALLLGMLNKKSDEEIKAEPLDQAAPASKLVDIPDDPPVATSAVATAPDAGVMPEDPPRVAPVLRRSGPDAGVKKAVKRKAKKRREKRKKKPAKDPEETTTTHQLLPGESVEDYCDRWSAKTFSSPGLARIGAYKSCVKELKGGGK